MKLTAIGCAALLTLVLAAPASAGEIFAGLHSHDVKTPLDKSGLESGIDLSLGYRSGPIAHFGKAIVQPYVFGALNSAGNTDYAAAGISVRLPLGKSLYLRPGLGLAIHDGSAGKYFRSDKIAFGSRVLIEPELALGTRLSRRVTAEASWIHMSHGQLEGKENPGIDNLGLRLNFAL